MTRVVPLLLLAALLALGASQVIAAPSGPCGSRTKAAVVKHVIWIFMENRGFDQVIGSRAAPFQNWLAARCGLASNFHAIAHPSLPNYIAATSGDTHGIVDDGPP